MTGLETQSLSSNNPLSSPFCISVFTDIVMTHTSGPELIERLRQIRKHFKVRYMTWYTDEEIVQHGLLGGWGGIELIHKPFYD